MKNPTQSVQDLKADLLKYADSIDQRTSNAWGTVIETTVIFNLDVLMTALDKYLVIIPRSDLQKVVKSPFGGDMVHGTSTTIHGGSWERQRTAALDLLAVSEYLREKTTSKEYTDSMDRKREYDDLNLDDNRYTDEEWFNEIDPNLSQTETAMLNALVKKREAKGWENFEECMGK